MRYVIDILHGFKSDIPEYLLRGDKKALECYVARCRRQKKCNKGYISILEKIKAVYERIYIINKYMYLNHVYILQNKVKCLVKSRLMLVSFYKLNNDPKITF